MNLSPKHEVQQLLIAVNELALEIVNSQLVLKALPQELQKVYAVEALQTIQEFEVLNTKLKSSLEGYFEYEKQNNLPTYLNYHRIYRGLNQQ